ncbi:hypothetical protein [Glaciimonas immobilis]|uniref:7-keto-8-aminopelargonate synthetase-like enzyme n=1 Tax=Glaciimonas immobilis TaxID=728004 RepID=A0A840RMR9_9BURK|nr:hypothetical protein [Glaciimonas immobilis]KAF3996851.1 hypothetical protein HAV38_16835 [Glaciimonas immobilis]MBB5199597.1 7-keto-8-aminopelargonate synthetase-like enzyme [Glaciimonas immobilis]
MYLSKALFDQGYYCSPVFFPVVAKGRAGVRLMLRGDLPSATVQSFVDHLKNILSEMGVEH